MLLALAQNDFTKINFLKSAVKKKTLYDQYYKMQVMKLNELIEHVAYMEHIEAQKPIT